MVEIIGVRFNSAGKIYYFDPKGREFRLGVKVLVETARGVEMGRVVIANKMVDDSEVVAPLKPIIRPAEEADFRQLEENNEKEKEAFEIASKKIAEHQLDMKLVNVEYTFDRSKILFYFTADGRVDFRDLVKSLAGVFRTRIELRQIGVRDEARQLGSLGICGRNLCCSTFLDDFRPVSIKMAKEQGLSLNPTKISGVCGRLMCCLQYEQNAYDDMLKKMPHKGVRVETPEGIGTIIETATLKGEVKVKIENGDAVRFVTCKLGEFRPVSCKCPHACHGPQAEDKDPELPQAQDTKAEPAALQENADENAFAHSGKGRRRRRDRRKKITDGDPQE